MVNKATFTGVDDRTDLDELARIAKEYPFVEFGVLISRNNTGSGEKNRYPGAETIRNLKHLGLQLSAHICGSLARDAISTGNFAEMVDFLVGMECGSMFDRYQLNIAGMNASDMRVFEYQGDKPIIIQVKDSAAFRYYKDMHKASGLVQALFDESCGEGRYDYKGFHKGFGAPGYVGFAGGISAENAAFTIGYITTGKAEKKAEPSYWIDMESSVRTDDWFDTEKVRKACEQIAPFASLGMSS